MLVDNLLVAFTRWTGLVKTRLLADVDQRRHTAEVVGLRFQTKEESTVLWLKKKKKSAHHQ